MARSASRTVDLGPTGREHPTDDQPAKGPARTTAPAWPAGCTTSSSDLPIYSVDDVLAAVEAVGRAAGDGVAAAALTGSLRARLAAVERAVAGRARPRVLVLEWTDPPYLAGHWVPELVHRAGGQPVGANPGGRSVATAWADLPAADVAVVAPCGYGLDGALAQCPAVAARLPGMPLVAIDSASYVVQAGPALVDGVEALAWALHPDVVAPPPAGRIARAALSATGGGDDVQLQLVRQDRQPRTPGAQPALQQLQRPSVTDEREPHRPTAAAATGR